MTISVKQVDSNGYACIQPNPYIHSYSSSISLSGASKEGGFMRPKVVLTMHPYTLDVMYECDIVKITMMNQKQED